MLMAPVILFLSQPRPQAFKRLSRDSVRLGAQHDSPRRIFPLNSTGEITFDFPPRKTVSLQKLTNYDSKDDFRNSGSRDLKINQ